MVTKAVKPQFSCWINKRQEGRGKHSCLLVSCITFKHDEACSSHLKVISGNEQIQWSAWASMSQGV